MLMQTEAKVTAATAGALLTPATLGALVVWLLNRFTSLDMPSNFGEIVGAVVLTLLGGAGAFLAGFQARSKTSGVSVAYDPAEAAEAHQETLRAHGEAGAVGTPLLVRILIVLAIIALVLVIVYFVNVNVDVRGA